MSTVFEQVFILFVFALIGYVLAKSGIADRSCSKLLSVLAVYVFLPCTVFKTFSTNFTIEYISTRYYFLLVSLCVLAAVFTTSVFVSKLLSQNGYERSVYRYSLIVPNFGYMGYALAEALYGSGALLNMIVFALPVTMFTYTVGFCTLTKTSFSPKRLFQPMIIAIFLGCISGLLSVPMPEVINQVLSKGSSCMGPCTMLLAGITISEFSIKSLLVDKRTYFVVLMRLLIIPCTVGFVSSLFCPKEVVMSSLLIYAMPCGLNTIVFPKLVGENCSIGASLACVSTVLSCITIPICLTLFL